MTGRLTGHSARAQSHAGVTSQWNVTLSGTDMRDGKYYLRLYYYKYAYKTTFNAMQGRYIYMHASTALLRS